MAFMAAPVIGGLTGWQLATVASTVLGGISRSSAASSERKAAEQNAANAVAAAEANRQRALQAAEVNKRNLETAAGQQRAAGQRAALEEAKKTRLAMSRALAIGAASGAGPAPENIFRGLVEQGEQNKASVMYRAEEEAKGFEDKGAIGLWQADTQSALDLDYTRRQSAANVDAARSKERGVNSANLFSGIGSLATMFAPTAMAPGGIPTGAPNVVSPTLGFQPYSGGYGGGDIGYYSPRF